MSSEEKSVATQTATANGPRVITIVATKGEKVKVPFDGNEWGDLKKLLEKGGKDANGKSFSGFDLRNMKCVESQRRGTLEHPKAIVPDGDFNLFLMPYKSKSGGSMSRADVNAKIKSFMLKDETRAKAHFNEGNNYTRKTTDDLVELIESYEPGTKKKVAANKAEAISQVVTSVKKAKSENNEDDILANLQSLGFEEKLDVVIALLLDIKSEGGLVSVPAVAEVKKPVEEVESAEAKAAREEREAKEKEEEKKRKEKEEEDRRLDKEAQDMMSGFDDVSRY
jgi:hypothetical protein